jgi:hypothetical protein
VTWKVQSSHTLQVVATWHRQYDIAKTLRITRQSLNGLISVKAIGLSDSQRTGCPWDRRVRLCRPVGEATYAITQVRREPQAGDLEEVGQGPALGWRPDRSEDVDRIRTE